MENDIVCDILRRKLKIKVLVRDFLSRELL